MMNYKQWIGTTLAIMMLSGVHVAQASSAYKNAGGIFEVTYPGNTASCFVCHTGYPGAMTAYGNQFKTAGGVGGSASTTAPLTAIAALDADNDGFTNVQEIKGLSDVNLATNTPFVTATGGRALTNVYVSGDAQAVESAITDIYTQAKITLPAGKEVMGGLTANTGVAVDIYATPSALAPVTLLFKAGSVDAAAAVYVVDTYAQTNTLIPTTEWALAANGGVQVKLLPAGSATPAKIVVVRTTPVVRNPVTNPVTNPNGDNENDGENDGEGGSSTGAGCISSQAELPLMMLFSMFIVGIFVRRKNNSSY